MVYTYSGIRGSTRPSRLPFSMGRRWWRCVLQGKCSSTLTCHQHCGASLWGGICFSQVGKSRAYSIQEVSFFLLFQNDLIFFFMCNTTSSGDTNHVKFHLHLPWIQLSLYHHEKGQTPPVWEPKSCHKAALEYFYLPRWGGTGRRWIPNFLGQTGAVHTTALLLCQLPLQHSRTP